MERHFASCVALIRDHSGTPYGAGFLIDRRHLLTCAHVVNASLGNDPREPAIPNAAISMILPFAGREPLTGRVAVWHPMIEYADREAERPCDMVVLRLDQDAPRAARMARLRCGNRNGGQPVRCFGFPSRAGCAGQAAEAVTIAEDSTGLLHLRQPPGWEPAIDQGYSGSPVFDVVSNDVIGMIVAFEAGRGQGQAQLSYGEATWRLRQAWRGLSEPRPRLRRFVDRFSGGIQGERRRGNRRSPDQSG